MKQYLQVDLNTHVIHATGHVELNEEARMQLAKQGRVVVENKGEFITSPHEKLCDPTTGEVRDNPVHAEEKRKSKAWAELSQLRQEAQDVQIKLALGTPGAQSRLIELDAQIDALKGEVA